MGRPTALPWEIGEGESLCDQGENKLDMSKELKGVIRWGAGKRDGASPSRVGFGFRYVMSYIAVRESIIASRRGGRQVHPVQESGIEYFEDLGGSL